MHNKICPSGLPNPYYERSSERILPGYSTPAATLPIRPSSSITDTTGLNKTGSSFGGLHGREGVSSNKKPAGSETRAGLLYSPIPKHHQPPTFATIPQNATPSQNWKSNDIRGPLAPIEADPTGHCERLTCHQCRLKTTRPKMICDQSLDPNCVVRICRPCLMDRKAYDDMPELRAPIFEFVPGGKLLCMKCRNICPCISCRRARGENGVMGNGLNGFYDLTDEARVEKLLKKKNRNGKDTPRKASHRRPNLADKKTIFSNRDITSVAHKHGNGQYKRAASEHIICLEKSWSELTGKSEQTISGRRSDVSGGSRKVKANRSTRSDHPGWRASTITKSSDSDQWSRNRKLCAEKISGIESDGTQEDMLMSSPLKSESSFAKVDSNMASIHRQKKNNSFDSKDDENNLLERHKKRLKLQLRELKLKKAREELARNNATAEGFAKAKMMQDFLRCGSSFEEALKATEICLGPARSQSVAIHSNCRKAKRHMSEFLD